MYLSRIPSGLRTILKDPDVWILWIGLQLPSLQVLFKYLSPRLQPFIVIYMLAAFAVYADLLYDGWLKQHLRKILFSCRIMICLIIVTLGVNYFLYPIADALKYQMRGSDRDDALIMAGNRLWALVSPYAEKTYLGNPISTGPGLVLLLLPCLTFGRYFLITPLILAAVAYTLYRISDSFFQANLFLVLCLSSPAFWEFMVLGGDMFIIGGLLVLCLVWFYGKVEKNSFYLICGILFLALAADTRIVFIYLVPLLSLFLWKRRPLLGYTVFLGALFSALLIHGVFYFWDPSNYTPLHLIGKGDRFLPGYLKIGFIICALAVGWFTFKRLTDDLVLAFFSLVGIGYAPRLYLV